MPYRDRPERLETRELVVRTEELGAAGKSAFVLTWAAWAGLAIAGSLFLDPGARLVGAAALALVGFLPALAAANIASRREGHRLRLDRTGVFHDGADEPLLDLEKSVGTCVFSLGDEQALLIAQGATRLILFGQGIAEDLGGRSAWGVRWHDVSVRHLGHREDELGPGTTWSAFWSVGASGATIIGGVSSCGSLRLLAERARDLAERHESAVLVLPTAHAEHPLITIDRDGRLRAFGESIDLRAPIQRTYVWALGKKNPRGDADAVILQQGDSDALRLSVSPHPGRGPSLSGFPGASIDLPSPEVPREELLSPAAFGALDGYLDRVGQSVAPDRAD